MATLYRNYDRSMFCCDLKSCLVFIYICLFNSTHIHIHIHIHIHTHIHTHKHIHIHIHIHIYIYICTDYIDRVGVKSFGFRGLKLKR